MKNGNVLLFTGNSSRAIATEDSGICAFIPWKSEIGGAQNYIYHLIATKPESIISAVATTNYNGWFFFLLQAYNTRGKYHKYTSEIAKKNCELVSSNNGISTQRNLQIQWTGGGRNAPVVQSAAGSPRNQVACRTRPSGW